MNYFNVILKAFACALMRLSLSIASLLLYGFVLLPAGFAMLVAYVSVFVGVATLVIATVTKLVAPHLSVYPEVAAAGFLFLGAAGIFALVQFGIFLSVRLQGSMARWGNQHDVRPVKARGHLRFGMHGPRR
jgi:hypothetical protein